MTLLHVKFRKGHAAKPMIKIKKNLEKEVKFIKIGGEVA